MSIKPEEELEISIQFLRAKESSGKKTEFATSKHKKLKAPVCFEMLAAYYLGKAIKDIGGITPRTASELYEKAIRHITKGKSSGSTTYSLDLSKIVFWSKFMINSDCIINGETIGSIHKSLCELNGKDSVTADKYLKLVNIYIQ